MKKVLQFCQSYLLPALVLLSLLMLPGSARAQDAGPIVPLAADTMPPNADQSFTYQGLLKDAQGRPVNNMCDFTFTQYNSVSATTPIPWSSPATAPGVAVTNGYFTATANSNTAIKFQGNAYWIEVAVKCNGDSAATTLAPRQQVTGAPMALTLAPNAQVANSRAAGDSRPVITVYDSDWSMVSPGFSASNPAAIFATSDLTTNNGIGVWGAGHFGGLFQGATGVRASGTTTDVDAAGSGVIKSVAGSKVHLSPHSMVVRGSSGIALTPLQGGGMQIDLTVGAGTRYVSIPFTTFGTLFGSQLYVKEATICYKVANSANIIATAVSKHDSATETGEIFYIRDVTGRTNITKTCYTSSANTPYQAIDDASWVQFNLTGNAGGASQVYIYSTSVTLVENPQ